MEEVAEKLNNLLHANWLLRGVDHDGLLNLLGLGK
jgi:hypothetical protein